MQPTRRAFLASASAACLAASDPVAARRDTMLRDLIAHPYPPTGAWHYEDFALAAYHLNQRTEEAGRAILTVRGKEFPGLLKENNFHWHAYILERIYFLFRDRMGAEAVQSLLDMLWRWASPSCCLSMAAPGREWWTWGSENHHAQAWSGFWGAAQIFAALPEYRSRRYADGATPAQMAAAFTEYFKRFARERAASGLLVECNSDYNKYTLGGWYNMADFAEDAALRRRMTMLLDLFWADWAIEQIDGVRGGSRHRCYPGNTSTALSPASAMAWFHFGIGEMSKHPSVMCAATTSYRPSPVVARLALDANRRGVYEYVSRRPGRNAGRGSVNFVEPGNPFHEPRGVYSIDPAAAGIVRYTWATPDFVMGTSMVEARAQTEWANISSQNRWEGVVFGGHRTARIFVQPLNPPKGSVYNANWSVQKKGVLIVQRLKTSNAKGQRIWFDKSLARVESGGWVFAEAPRAFAAVRVAAGGTAWEPDTAQQHHEGQGSPSRGLWLRCRDDFSPVLLEVARKAEFADFTAFQKAILANSFQWDGRKLEYRSAHYKTSLALQADYSEPPRIDGAPVNYRPGKVYDSPYLQSGFGTGAVRIRAGGGDELTLDFN